MVDLLVGRHRGRGERLALVGRSRLGVLGEREHEDRAEALRHPAEEHGAPVRARQPRRLTAEQSQPVRLVAPFGVGEGAQDLALLAVATRGELSVDLRLGALVDEVLRPATTVAGRGFCGRAQSRPPRRRCGDPSTLSTPARKALLEPRIASISGLRTRRRSTPRNALATAARRCAPAAARPSRARPPARRTRGAARRARSRAARRSAARRARRGCSAAAAAP